MLTLALLFELCVSDLFLSPTCEGLSAEVPSSLLNLLSTYSSLTLEFLLLIDRVIFQSGDTPGFVVLGILLYRSSGVINRCSSTELLNFSSVETSKTF